MMKVIIHLFLTSLIISTHAATVDVLVGRRVDSLALVFAPDVISAPIDSFVRFQFFPQNHSVARSTFDSPCIPLGEENDGFFSDFHPVAADATVIPTFTIQVKDAEPIYIYCTQGRHCQNGMVGVINPRANETIDAFRAKAMAQPFTLDPNESPPPVASTSPTASATAATITTSAPNTAATTSQYDILPKQEPAISTGIILGIAVGAMGIMCIAGVGVSFLIYSWRRRKHVKQAEGEIRGEKKKRSIMPFWQRETSLREIDMRRRMPNGM